MSKKYHIITYGCQMNKSDSERIAAFLEKKKYKPVLKKEKADLIVVNMCSVRQSAVDRIHGLTKKLEKLKTGFSFMETKGKKRFISSPTKNKKPEIILTGCILKKDKQRFKEKFDQIWEKENLFNLETKYKSDSLAYIPISNGCNNFCSFCVVPFTRGPLVCRSHKKILKEIKKAVKEGKKEIWLLGQNVNDYSCSIDSKINFAKLIKMTDEIPGNFKFFFLSPHPKNFSNELINILGRSKKFGKYLNLPVQSGDNQILKKMNRNYTVKEYKILVEKIQKKIPGIKLSTDIIVGFPGETKKQFQNTEKLLKKIKFFQAYVSKYSVRPGTVAFNLKDDISLLEKKKREQCLMNLVHHHASFHSHV